MKATNEPSRPPKVTSGLVLCRVCTNPATGPLCLDCESMRSRTGKRRRTR